MVSPDGMFGCIVATSHIYYCDIEYVVSLK
jgi:hypothetical protein